MDENIKLLHCLEEIPQAMEDILTNRKTISKEFVHLFQTKQIRKIYFSGQASGIYIGMILKYFIQDIFKIEVEITNPAEYVTYDSFNINGVYASNQLCMICPAHSGSTKGPIEMAKKCNELDIPVICTTYNIKSELAKLSNVVIHKRSNEEDSYIETKGHFASLMCLYVCFIEYGLSSGFISSENYTKYINDLYSISMNINNNIDLTEIWYENNKNNLLLAPIIRYVTNGEYEGAVLEGGLKIAETTHKACLYYEMEEFMHRSTTQINKDSVIFLVAPKNQFYHRMIDLEKWCKQYSNSVYFVCRKEENNINNSDFKIITTDSRYFSPLDYILPFEVLAYLMSEDLNISVIKAANDGASAQLKTHND
ncbi:iron dicitrate transport regulator FecR [Anaerorhabdus sp.]|uniref:iron dicitrate transport regulator FecR n=1 Tax=Anaerorhabdus sp. TaxID=1872524 RepID=UPI002FCC7287